MEFESTRIEKILPKLDQINAIEDGLETISAQSVLAKKFAQMDKQQRGWVKFLDEHVASVESLLQDHRKLIALHMDLEDLYESLQELHEDLLRHHVDCQEDFE